MHQHALLMINQCLTHGIPQQKASLLIGNYLDYGSIEQWKKVIIKGNAYNFQ